MYVKAGILSFASAAAIFMAAEVSASNNVEELKKVHLSSVATIQAPMTTGHYLVANVATPDTMTDALPADVQNKTGEEFGTLLSVETAADFPEDTVHVNLDQSANSILKQPIYDRAGQRLGTIHDIIVDRTGQMMKVVVADGGMMSVGDKKAAFDGRMMSFDTVNQHHIIDITEQDIADAKTFSYDPSKASATVEAMPPEGLSIKRLSTAKLVNDADEVVADIENISFDFNNNINDLIVVYGQILGMGGEEVAVDFEKLRLIQDRKGTRFQLTDNQTAEFEAFKD